MSLTDIKASSQEEIKNQINTVQSTTVFHQITIDEYLLAKHEIEIRLRNIADDFIAIGFRLRQINDSEAYRQEGYTSISEFAEKEYNIKGPETSRLMSINMHFSVGGYSDRLKPEYKNYGTSLLYEMTKLAEDDRRLIVAGTTVASIRELKRFNREAEEKAVSKTADDKPENNSTEAGETLCKEAEHEETACNTAEVVTAEILSTKPTDYSDLEKIIIEFFRNERELLNEIYRMSDYESIADRINPSGSRTFRKTIYMLFMYGYGDGLILKKMGEENKSYTWQQFIETTVDIYKATYTDHDTVWENFYKPEPEAAEAKEAEAKTAETKTAEAEEQQNSENRQENNKESKTTADTADTDNMTEQDAVVQSINYNQTNMQSDNAEKTEPEEKAEPTEKAKPTEETEPAEKAEETGKEKTSGSSHTLATSQENNILSLRKWYLSNKHMSLDIGVKYEIYDRLCIRTTQEALEKIAEFIEELTAEYTAYVYKNMGGRNNDKNRQ